MTSAVFTELPRRVFSETGLPILDILRSSYKQGWTLQKACMRRQFVHIFCVVYECSTSAWIVSLPRIAIAMRGLWGQLATIAAQRSITATYCESWLNTR